MAAPRSYRVLVADDDQGCRDSLVALLSHEGFLAQSVDDGQRAIELIRARRLRRPVRFEIQAKGLQGAGLQGAGVEDFDFLILDYNLPDVTGVDVLRTIRAEPRFYLPSIVVTGEFSVDLERTVLELGGFAVVPKPVVEPSRFRSLVWNLVRSHFSGH